MALQTSGSSSLDSIRTIEMVTQQPQSNASMACISGYGVTDCTPIGSPLGLTVVPGASGEAVANTQGGESTRLSSNVMTGIKQIGHVVLRSTKEEQGQREQERRIRREIANSNERRRMQSINAGFKSLKCILPHTDGEKLSKAAILQQTSEYITQLESEKLKLMNQNEKLRRSFAECKCAPMKRRAFSDIFEKDEGIGSPAEEDFEDVRRGLIEVRHQLDKERRLRISYEDQIRNLEKQVCPDRIKAMELSRSDERRSSSEGSPWRSKATIVLPSTATSIQPCPRLLLPPLLSKQDKSDLDILPLHDSPISRSMTSSAGFNVGQIGTATSSIITAHGKFDHVVANAKCCKASSDSMVTVFSHSTKSNQPLKKRAVEFHQQSLSDSGDNRIPSQFKKKIAVDQAASPYLSSLSVKSQETSGTKCAANIPSHSGPVVPTSQLISHSLVLSHHASQQLQGSQYTPQSPNHDAAAESTMTMPSGSGFAITSSHLDVSARNDQDVYALIESMPMPENSGSLNQLHVTLGAQPDTGIPYIRQSCDKLISVGRRLPHPSYVMTPMGSPGAVLVPMPPKHDFVGDPRRQMPLLTDETVRAISVGGNVHSPMATCQSESSQSGKMLTPVAQHDLAPANPIQQVSLPPQSMSGFHTSQSQTTQHVLCYSQPELTLNQLNAVPNLAPPKSLHQPTPLPISSSLIQTVGGDSPLYIGSVIQESVLQKPSVFVNSTSSRCRKFSTGATDSCSTASSTEDDDRSLSKNPLLEEHSNYLGQSSPSVKRPGVEAVDTEQKILTAAQGVNVAAYDEISQSSSPEKNWPPDGRDITDSTTSATSDSAVPVLPNLAGSPAVMRRIDAIQTRRNLETIVQAIDHLEQQERRNSQDRSDLAAPES